MKTSKVFTSFLGVTVLATTGCDLFFNETDEPALHERHILKTYVLDISNKESTFLVDGENPFPIPNTSRILYKDDGKLYTINLDGTGKKFISMAPGAAGSPANYGRISSDGSKFVFIGYEQKYVQPDIFLVNTDGIGYINLTKSIYKTEGLGDFDPKNERILFHKTTYNESNNFVSADVSTMNTDGGNYQTIFNEGAGAYLQFAFNGRRIIFFRGDSRTGTDMYLLDLNTQELKIVRIGTEILSPTPVVTHDDKLLYVGDRTDVYRLDLTTFEKKKLYSGMLGEQYSYSRDFNKMAYFSQSYFSRGIHIVDFQKNEDDLVSERIENNLWHLQFSQDNSKIIYTTHKLEIYYE